MLKCSQQRLSQTLFDVRKTTILSGLLGDTTTRPDRSLKGSVDAPLLELIDAVNRDTRFVSTSCCSGRFAVFLESESGRKNEGRLLFAEHTSLERDGTWLVETLKTQFQRQWMTAYNKFKATPGLSNGLLLTEQQQDSKNTDLNIFEATSNPLRQNSAIIWFNVEPFIIHIECRDMESVKKLMEIAKVSGLKLSGIMSLGKRLTVAIRGSKKMYVPIGRKRDSSLQFDVMPTYVTTLINLGNQKLNENWNQIRRFQDNWFRILNPLSIKSPMEPNEIIGNSITLQNKCPIYDKSAMSSDVEDCLLWVAVSTLKDIKSCKSILESSKLFDRRRKITSFTHIERNQTSQEDLSEIVDAAALIPVTRPFRIDELNLTESGIILGSDCLGRLCVLQGTEQSDGIKPDGDQKTLVLSNSLRIFSLSKNQIAELPETRKTSTEEAMQSIIRLNFRKHFSSLSTVLPQNTSVNSIAIPNKYEKIGDIVLFSEGSFPVLRQLSPEVLLPLWKDITNSLKCRGIGIKGRIQGDIRESNVQVLYSDSLVVRHKENKVIYVFDITKCMFSAGNSKERGRVASDLVQQAQKVSHRPEIFVDMYCGIGYFTLPVLTTCPKSMVAEVWTCDWNPLALEYFRKGLEANTLQSDSRLSILYGDSRKLGLENGPDSGILFSRSTRVSLGLIPSSREGWRAAARICNPDGAILYIHGLQRKLKSGNSLSCEFANNVKDTMMILLNEEQGNIRWEVNILCVHKVKSYCPSQDHVVVDIECCKQK